jgi:hypothetical protein
MDAMGLKGTYVKALKFSAPEMRFALAGQRVEPRMLVPFFVLCVTRLFCLQSTL